MKIQSINIQGKVSNLKSYQQRKLEKILNIFLSNNEVDVDELLTRDKMICRVCNKPTRFVKNGHSSKGFQRYKCKKCGTTQSTHANTPINKKKKKELYVDFIYLMLSNPKPLTCDEISEELDIDRNTAHSWRHRFLTALNGVKELNLGNEVEMDEVFIKFCVKGNLGKEKFKKYDYYDKSNRIPNDVRLDEMNKNKWNTIWMCLHNRQGDFDFLPLKIQKNGKVSSDLIGEVMENIDLDGKVVISDQNTSISKFMRTRPNSTHITFKSDDIKLGILKNKNIHNNNINNIMNLYKRWAKHFYGNSTKYQWNYLKWFRFTRLFNENVKEITTYSLQDKGSFKRYTEIFDYYKKYLVA